MRAAASCCRSLVKAVTAAPAWTELAPQHAAKVAKCRVRIEVGGFDTFGSGDLEAAPQIFGVA